jgi:predicted DCC family thiol-disulfide oxidoreductase YuxK
MTDGSSTILYDGECRLCSGAVAFVRRRDRRGRFRFVPLGSAAAGRLLADGGGDCDTLHLLDAAGHHVRSAAVLRIAAGLGRPWSLLRFLRVVPAGLRNAAYDLVARHRRRWFGNGAEDACRRPR